MSCFMFNNTITKTKQQKEYENPQKTDNTDFWCLLFSHEWFNHKALIIIDLLNGTITGKILWQDLTETEKKFPLATALFARGYFLI